MKKKQCILCSTLALMIGYFYRTNHKMVTSAIAFFLAISLSLSGQQWYGSSLAAFTTQYNQSFTTWDNGKFYGQWDAVDTNTFSATDISNGYLQYNWMNKRILCSKNVYATPYILTADMDWSAGSSRGGIVLRVPTISDDIQVPANGDPGFNRQGIALYPSDDGLTMTVQFSGTIGTPTPVTRISVPKPASVSNLRNRGILRVEDMGASIYVYYNNVFFIRIDLDGLTDGSYTTGTVYNSSFQSVGTFLGKLVSVTGKIAIAQRDAVLRLYSADIKTVPIWTNQYNQFFTTWDNTTFYNQWNTVDVNAFSASDITSGYLQFVWSGKRILYSKNAYATYKLKTDMDWSAGSSRGGIVLRANSTNIDDVQNPATGDPGFNRQGIAIYPSDDGSSMTVQFSGTIATTTPVTQISIPKPVGVTNLRNRGTLTVEDFGSAVFVYYNELPFVKIELGGLTNDTYTSGTVYTSSMEVAGTFSGMLVPVTGKVAIAQRDALLRLYSVSINAKLLTPQTITFPVVAKKQITDATFALSATASSGLPITYMCISGPATFSGNTVTLTGQPGVVTISANQSGNSSYTPAQEVIRSIWVYDPAASSVSPTSQDYVDNWVATDALNRTVTTYAEAGAKKTNKVVGVFYYTWLGAHGDKVWSIPDILKQYPSDPLSPSNPGWGGYGGFHFWGEPEHGYYRSEDPWVIRRDLQMLSNAKVDFIYIDASNGYTYFETVKALCNVSMQMRKEGIYSPQIMFFSYANSGQVMNDLYDQFYANSLYEDLWFKWDGKPVILGVSTDEVLRPEVKNYFNIKLGWAWTNTPAESNHWQWLDSYPQDYGWSVNSATPEQICVSVASHPNNSQGNSYSNSTQPAVNSDYLTAYTGKGLYFAEQWARALSVNPPVIMVTQWNEWIAQRFPQPADGTYAGRPSVAGNAHFVDVFTEEFNRDMAPMKGGHTDNYYYQLISNIRKYKGMYEPQVYSTAATKTIDGNFTEWSTVTPVYQDPPGDVMHRNFAGYDPTVTYTNTTGRNDIIESRATYDANNLYFYVKTVANITAYTDLNWMLLFIDVDKNKTTGWEGYDYVVNLGVTSSTQTTLKQWNGSSWANPVIITYSLSGNQMELSIPRTAVGLSSLTPQFYFHWADNPQQLNDITSFFTDGESAPDRRFNYDFTAPVGIINGCFETPVTTTYQYGTMTNGWTFDTKTGVQRNASGMGAPTAPEGVQTSFINKTGVITQNVNFSAGSYKIGFFAAKKSGNTQTLKVYYDATLIGTITPASATSWTYYWSSAFTATAGAHTIKFVGTKTTDQTAFLDAVDIVLQTSLTNKGFETPVTTGITMGPLTNGWTFDGLSGVQKNGSAFGAPTAPEGIQTAVLQGGGSFYQDFAFATGSYKITFYAAYRPINTNTQSINVFCDDILIGNIVPTSSTSYGYYATNRFTVTAGTHRIKFAGVLASDNSTFIDNVNFVLGGYKAPELLTKLENLDIEITIYPNPALSQITLSNVQLNSQISIFTLDGKKVYSMLKKDSEPLSILVNSWCKGVYLVHIQTNNSNIVKKIIVK